MFDVIYAGFWIRAAAHAIDEICLELVSWILQLMLMGVLYWVMPSSTPPMSPLMEQVVGAVIFLLIALPYYVVLHARYGATPGKWVCRIQVVSADGVTPLTMRQSILRCFAYLLSYLPLGAGFLMAAFHPEKRALHDLVAQTVSIRVRDRRRYREYGAVCVPPST